MFNKEKKVKEEKYERRLKSMDKWHDDIVYKWLFVNDLSSYPSWYTEEERLKIVEMAYEDYDKTQEKLKEENKQLLKAIIEERG